MFLGDKKAQNSQWKHIDNSVWQEQNACNEPAHVFEKSLLLHDLFEILLTNTEMKRICVGSTNYVRLKGNHLFTMIVGKLKVFLTIILVSGYA